MKTRAKVIIGLALACAATLCLAGCASNSDPYKNRVTVRFDANGGQFASTPNTALVDMYDASAAKNGVKLLEPGSDSRGSGKASSTATRNGYILVGWYTDRTERVDSAGNKLDVYGNPVEYEKDENGDIVYETDSDGDFLYDEEGNKIAKTVTAVGYHYSGRWNFDSDYFTVDSDWKYSKNTYDFTLYAAWVPNYTFTFYLSEDGSETKVGTYSFNPLLQTEEILIPELNETTGGMNNKSFPNLANKTFEAAYTDAARTQKITQSVFHTGVYDDAANNIYKGINYTNGTSSSTNMDIYVEYIEGSWYQITTAKQFIDVNSGEAYYNILADLNFSGVTWSSSSIYRGEFSGRIYGNGHTFSNIEFSVTDTSLTQGGLFGSLTKDAVIDDVTFKDSTITFTGVGRFPDSYYGFFAGSVVSGATVTGVTFDHCTLRIGNVTNSGGSFGLVRGNYEDEVSLNVAYENGGIALEMVQSDNPLRQWPYNVTVSNGTGGIKLISKDDDFDKEPEIEYVD